MKSATDDKSYLKIIHLLRGRNCYRRPQNQQICLPQNADFYKTVSKAAYLIFVGAVDL